MADAKTSFDVRYVQRGEEHSAAYQRQQAEARLEPGTDYSMPRKQHADQSIDFSGMLRASAHVPIPSNNKGYILLQKMGWSGSGLGRNMTGTAALPARMCWQCEAWQHHVIGRTTCMTFSKRVPLQTHHLRQPRASSKPWCLSAKPDISYISACIANMQRRITQALIVNTHRI